MLQTKQTYRFTGHEAAKIAIRILTAQFLAKDEWLVAEFVPDEGLGECLVLKVSLNRLGRELLVDAEKPELDGLAATAEYPADCDDVLLEGHVVVTGWVEDDE